MNNAELVEATLKSVQEVEEGGYNVVHPLGTPPETQNQPLFFIKPECFDAGVDSKAVLQAIFDAFSRFSVEVRGIITVTGGFLEKSSSMDRHYGFINRVSKALDEVLEPSEVNLIRDKLSVKADTAVLGGHQALQKYTKFSAKSLDQFWATKKSVKIRSGLYTESYDIDGENVVLVNGFHPFQLEHFTRSNARVVLMPLASALPWSMLRRTVLGDTFPERAGPDSIRGELFRRAKDVGLGSVSIANNCCHMSAGPFEALFEENNFFGPIPELAYEATSSRIGQVIGDKEKVETALRNPDLKAPLSTDLYDATEELDTDSSVQVLKSFI